MISIGFGSCICVCTCRKQTIERRYRGLPQDAVSIATFFAFVLALVARKKFNVDVVLVDKMSF